MLKKNKKKIILSSAIILLPVLFGLIIWNQLPDQIATHWGINGEPDGWSSRGFAVFTLPLILLAAHWICIWVTALDPKNKRQTPKAFDLIFWITPVISLSVNSLIYITALGKDIDLTSIMFIVLSIIFIIIGNYLPKCKQNYTIGIKVPWTLNNEENWVATHRFAGKVWVAGGILFLPCIFLPSTVMFVALFILILFLAGIPMIYSYLYYKKQLASSPQE